MVAPATAAAVASAVASESPVEPVEKKHALFPPEADVRALAKLCAEEKESAPSPLVSVGNVQVPAFGQVRNLPPELQKELLLRMDEALRKQADTLS